LWLRLFKRFSVGRGQDWFGFKISSRLFQFGKFSRITVSRELGGGGEGWLISVELKGRFHLSFLGVNFGWFEVDIT
jgi:hypothetical protein